MIFEVIQSADLFGGRPRTDFDRIHQAVIRSIEYPDSAPWTQGGGRVKNNAQWRVWAGRPGAGSREQVLWPDETLEALPAAQEGAGANQDGDTDQDKPGDSAAPASRAIIFRPPRFAYPLHSTSKNFVNRPVDSVIGNHQTGYPIHASVSPEFRAHVPTERASALYPASAIQASCTLPMDLDSCSFGRRRSGPSKMLTSA